MVTDCHHQKTHWYMKECKDLPYMNGLEANAILHEVLSYYHARLLCGIHWALLCLISITCSLAKVARLFDPERFDPSKLTVRYDNGANVVKGKSFEDLLPRKYTLTHSDITGELLLSVGPSFNRLQVSLTCKLGIVFKLGLGY